MPSRRFEGKTALVFGGRGGMGAAVSTGLRAEGATVYVADISPRVEASDVVHLEVDVTSSTSTQAAFDEVQARSGCPDVVVFLAGAFEARPFLDSDDEIFARLYAINTFGGARVVREAGRRMRALGRGAVVVVASRPRLPLRPGRIRFVEGGSLLPYEGRRARAGSARNTMQSRPPRSHGDSHGALGVGDGRRVRRSPHPR